MEMKLFFPGATTLQFREIGTIQSGQDEAYGDYLFRFNAKGICSVYTTDRNIFQLWRWTKYLISHTAMQYALEQPIPR